VSLKFFFAISGFYLLFSMFPLHAQKVSAPVHGKNFKMKCALCHNTESWHVKPRDIRFDHNSTGFPLLGAHKTVRCRQCHQDLVFSHVGNQCADCHTDIHQGTLGHQCQRCHNTWSWENRQKVYELHQQMRFPLIGAHAALDCQACHTTEAKNEYALKRVECSSCHLETYRQTINPAHRKAGFSLQCEHCHSLATNGWRPAQYTHTAKFPLQGGHAGLECNNCHSSGYSNISQECVTCHLADFNRTKDPDHQIFGFPTSCEQCHSIQNWESSPFDHLAISGFALVGAHADFKRVKCTDCHIQNRLSGLPRDCYGCHEKNYIAVTDPNHVQGQFSHDCMQCHSQQAWSPATFDHDQTNFPLTGAHQTAVCTDCHINGKFAGTPTDCYNCHQNNFEQVNDPDHVKNQFSHDCSTCHNASAWSPATFDHNQTKFPLTGAHQTVVCIACHQSGYTNTPIECVSCHQQNYDNTTDPNHRGAQFPTTCQDCHTTTAWSPANWDHDGQYFPIYSGKHKNEWNVCTDCHVNQADYSQFSCFAGCHEHNRSKTDDQHREVANYVYESNACYSCHPNGTGEGEGGD